MPRHLVRDQFGDDAHHAHHLDHHERERRHAAEHQRPSGMALRHPRHHCYQQAAEEADEQRVRRRATEDEVAVQPRSEAHTPDLTSLMRTSYALSSLHTNNTSHPLTLST